MEKRQNINAPIFNISNQNVTFVEGLFRSKDGKMISGYFLVDTGSSDNSLSPAVMDWIGSDCITDGTREIAGINEEGEKCPLANLEISIGGHTSTEKFCLSKSSVMSKYFGNLRIVGILGSCFLIKHGLTLDFEKLCLRSSTEDDIDISNMPYTFPMSCGLSTYGVPLVGITKGEQLFMFVADSGCDQSLMTKYAAENGCMNYQYTSVSGTTEDSYNAFNINVARVKHQLASYDSEKQEFKTIESDSSFGVLDDRDCLRESTDKSTPPISGLLSAGYMLEHKWILDFKRQIIYAKAA